MTYSYFFHIFKQEKSSNPEIDMLELDSERLYLMNA